MEIISQYESLLVGFFGAILGAAVSIATVYIQSRIQAKKDQVELIAKVAIEDWKAQLEFAKHSDKPSKIAPLVAYIHYHLELSKRLEKGSLTEEDIEAMNLENGKIIDSLLKINKK